MIIQLNSATTVDDYKSILSLLKSLRVFKDSEDLLKKCYEAIKQLRNKEVKRIEVECNSIISILDSEKKIKPLSAKLENLRRRIGQFQTINELNNEQNCLNSENSNLEKELSSLGRFAFSRKKEINNIIENNKKRLEEIKRILNSSNAELVGIDINVIKSEYSEIKKELSQLNARLAEAQIQLSAREENSKYGKIKSSILFLDKSYIRDGEFRADEDLKGFYITKGIKSVVIPNNVTCIGDNAFWDCKGLLYIYIPESVLKIGDYAFGRCNGLTTIRIPESVSSIGDSAFKFCENLTNIFITKNVTSIGDFAFESCNNLRSILIDPENTKYDSRDNCNAIIDTETNTLLVGCNNTIIPDSVKCIKAYAFPVCEFLTNIYIPKSVNSIDAEAFWACSNLASIVVDPENTKYDSRNNCNAIVETETNTLILGCYTTVIPSSVTDIGYYAFGQNDSITSIDIPDSVTRIGKEAFYCCENISDIYIPNSVKYISEEAFQNCKGVNRISIPNSIVSIGKDAFKGCEDRIIIRTNGGTSEIAYSDFLEFTVDKDKCAGCGLCNRICHEGAITFTDYIAPGKRRPAVIIDSAKCIKCGKCFNTCRFKAIIKTSKANQLFSGNKNEIHL